MEKPVVVGLIHNRQAKRALQAIGCEVITVASQAALLKHRTQKPPRLFVVEVVHSETAKIFDLVATLRKSWPMTDVVVWAPRATGNMVRAAFRSGAKDVVVSNVTKRLADSVQQILDDQQFLPLANVLAEKRARGSRFESMLSRSNTMWDLFELCARVARSDATVFIVGETGTGKELLARAVHRRSNRQGRFVAANCASISAELIDSELFGYEKGAITGADQSKKGLVVRADGGTLFLDEIGDMPEQSQLSLLRMLQEKKIRPVGSREKVPINVRIVAATNTALDEKVQAGNFREDLFYRLDVIRINVPPLRERPEDVVFLFGHFVKKLAKHYGSPPPSFSDSFLDTLVAHDWPGNVRELDNFAERVVLSRPQRRLTPRDFLRLTKAGAPGATSPPLPPRRERTAAIDPTKTLAANLSPLVEHTEKEYLTLLLKANQGRIGRSAEQAGISRRTLLRKIKAHNIDKTVFKP